MQPINADTINGHLASGGVVQVTTYGRSTIYKSRHAGWFKQQDGSLHVRYGRSWNQLSIGDRMLVGIRMGKMQ